jgi:ribonuclease HII
MDPTNTKILNETLSHHSNETQITTSTTTTIRKKREPLKLCYSPNEIEVGIDEAGRGTFIGRVYVAGVILPEEFPDDRYIHIQDSKKLSKKRRAEMREYIEENALAYAICYAEPWEIDQKNILQCVMEKMHEVIDTLNIEPSQILVDGDRFKIYVNKNGDVIPHKLCTGGDNTYMSIAAASILAKEYHDEHIRNLLEENPGLEVFKIGKNMGYGTKDHIEAIKQYGISKWHRKTFGCCKEAPLNKDLGGF